MGLSVIDGGNDTDVPEGLAGPTYVICYFDGGSALKLAPEEWVDEAGAVQAWAQGIRVVARVTSDTGAPAFIDLAKVDTMILSTPETRKAGYARDEAQRVEHEMYCHDPECPHNQRDAEPWQD